MTAPRKDPEAFLAWQLGTAAMLEHRELTPETALSDLMAATLSSNHRRRRPPTAADVRKVKLDTALAFYADRFGDASDFTFVITGAVELDELRPLVLTYLGSLPGKRGLEPWKDLGIKLPKGVIDKQVKRGSEPKAAVQIVFQGDDTWSLDADRDLGILRDVLNIRLREIMREDMSGVYGVRVRASFSRKPRERRSVSISFGCAPENVAALRRAAQAEIARMQREGVDQTYLDKVKAEATRAHETDLRENHYWIDILLDWAMYGDDPHLTMALEPVLARMTSDDVKAAALRFLPLRQMVTGVLLPARVAATPSPTVAPGSPAPPPGAR
jgi:zinc protease